MATGPNPKDSMKSTWRTDKTRSSWNISHYLLNLLNLHPTDLDKPVPVHDKSDKVPYMPAWSTSIFVLVHAFVPIAIHQLYIIWKGKNLHPALAFLLYAVSYQGNAIHQIQVLRRLGHRLGFLDGDKHERDQVPDVGVTKTFLSLWGITTLRPLYTIFIAYRTNTMPSISWWLPVELCLYSIILDGWFYLYHRSCHEVDFLWKFHRTHHLTKHPNTMLSSYADAEQEVLEMMLIPLATYGCLKLMGFPMGFWDCWICLEFLLFSEAFGHSGLRVYTTPPGTSTFILEPMGCGLVTEDHDLHHRKGYRKSYNYGKQTRFWDRIFGTCLDRVESHDQNVDWNNVVTFPLF